MARAASDAGAFRELCERYAPEIQRYLEGRCRDRHAAEDLTGETFARAWYARDTFRDVADGSAGPWLYTIARNLLVSTVRRRRLELIACARLGILDGFDRPLSDAEPDESWLDGADALLDTLPPAQREAIRLHIVEDLGYEEAARRLATSPQVVRKRVSRGLSALRDAARGSRSDR